MKQPGNTNSQVAVVSPPSAAYADCAVTVEKDSRLESASGDDAEQMLGALLPAEVHAALSKSYGDVHVMEVSTGELDRRPAHLVRARYSFGTESGKAFASVRMVSTVAPGARWSVDCGGAGRSFDEAESGYRYWKAAMDNIILSFQFTPLSPSTATPAIDKTSKPTSPQVAPLQTAAPGGLAACPRNLKCRRNYKTGRYYLDPTANVIIP